MARLANATAVIASQNVPVIFDAEFREGAVGIGMGAAAPQMYLLNEAIPEDFVDSTITVNGALWRVEDCRADANGPAGTSLVILEKA